MSRILATYKRNFLIPFEWYMDASKLSINRVPYYQHYFKVFTCLFVCLFTCLFVCLFTDTYILLSIEL